MSGPAKYNSPSIPAGFPALTDLMYAANPDTGIGFTFPASELLTLVSAVKPVSNFATISALLANTTIGLGYLALVLDASGDPVARSGWAIYLYQGPTRTNLSNYILVTTQVNKSARGPWSLGIYNEEYPNVTDGAIGSGPAGTIQEGDWWYIPSGGEGDLELPGIGVTALYAGAMLRYLGGTITDPSSWKVTQ